MPTQPLPAAIYLLLALAIASAHAADAPATRPAVDGVYFLSAPAGRARVLILDGHAFRLIDPSCGEIRGELFVNPDSLSFRYFDGKDSILANCSYSVIDGHLWIGVFPTMGPAFVRCEFLGLSSTNDMARQARPPEGGGAAIVAPKSIDLGPVNLIPVKLTGVDALQLRPHDDVTATWECESNNRLEVSVALPPATAPSALERLPLHPGQPAPELVRQAISQIVYEPDEHGIVMKTIAWNCGMNHGDYAGYVYWFAIGNGDRAVRFVYPATHGELPGQTSVVQFFHKKRPLP